MFIPEERSVEELLCYFVDTGVLCYKMVKISRMFRFYFFVSFLLIFV